MSEVSLPQPLKLPRPSLGQVRLVALWVVAVVALKVGTAALQAHGIIQASTPWPTVLLGIIIGLTYGLLAVGLILIYRTNGIINFAHGQIGAFAAAFFGLAALKWHVPYWVAFPLALVVGAGTGAAAETGVVRRLRRAPRLMSVVATLGVGQFLVLFAQVINSSATRGSLYPLPPGLPTFDVGALHVTRAYSGMLLLSPLVVIVIAVFLRFSRYGLAMRAAASNPEAARMAGIAAVRMSGLAWAIAGALSAFSAILTQPTQGFISGDSFGPALLLRAMTGAVLARMSSLPRAMLAGVGLGVVEQLLLWNYPQGGLVELTLFGIILVTLLLQRDRGGRDQEKGSWATVQALRPVPDFLRRIWLVRNLGTVSGFLLVATAVTVPFLASNTTCATLIGMMGFMIIGLSVGILTGLGGQLTLGQFAVGAMGGVVSYYVSSRTGNYPMALLYGACAAALVCALLGLPALRVRGLMLTVTTLSFALVTPAFIMGKLVGKGVEPGHPTLPGGYALDTAKTYFWFALALLLVALLISRNVRKSGFGRLLVSVRDNEDNARAFTVSASRVKLQGYLLAGFIAGLGGAAYTYSLSLVSFTTFPAKASIDAVVITVVGGISVLSGPILGALFVIGLPALVHLGSLALAATSLGQLILILYMPGGLVQLLGGARDRLLRLIARVHGVDYEQGMRDAEANEEAQEAPAVALPRGAAPAVRVGNGTGVILQARQLRKRFGGVVAVDDVSFDVFAGETLGLLGPNGAGKTTTFELLGGFTKLDSGSVSFQGQDVTRLGAEQRGRLGLIRSFQDAALFPTMTVVECVMLALERVQPTSIVGSVAGWRGSERAKAQRARELVSAMGLGRYRDKQIRELSTGTRRITEIACMVALEPTVMLLDEPSSGIAQRETEALGQLLLDLKKQLGMTLVIIEHDIPLIMSISDRIVAMADGRVICSGSPDVVRADPVVVQSYLGGDVTAIERSGPTVRGLMGAGR